MELVFIGFIIVFVVLVVFLIVYIISGIVDFIRRLASGKENNDYYTKRTLHQKMKMLVTPTVNVVRDDIYYQNHMLKNIKGTYITKKDSISFLQMTI